MKPFLIFLLCIALLCLPAGAIEVLPEDTLTLSADAACLMEQSTGEIIYEKNALEHLPPASVTKVMTMLLICEAIDAGRLSLEDMITTSARAASMGGSQVFLKEGEQLSVEDMLKCIAVVSANDCCVAMAEHLSGTEEAFVQDMNDRAEALGMDNTHFTCCSGLLESEDHYSCARDIAVMSRELLCHEVIRNYTGIWMDSIRNGSFGLSNTNRLIYYYQGATGLKTGFTSRAMYCLSASAMRDDVEYIAVVLHAPSSAQRFDDAKTMLSYAFANYTLLHPSQLSAIPPVTVEMGQWDTLQPVLQQQGSFLIRKTHTGTLSYEMELPESVKAPIAQGQALGTLHVRSGDDRIADIPLLSPVEIGHLTSSDIFLRLLQVLLAQA